VLQPDDPASRSGLCCLPAAQPCTEQSLPSFQIAVPSFQYEVPSYPAVVWLHSPSGQPGVRQSAYLAHQSACLVDPGSAPPLPGRHLAQTTDRSSVGKEDGATDGPGNDSTGLVVGAQGFGSEIRHSRNPVQNLKRS